MSEDAPKKASLPPASGSPTNQSPRTSDNPPPPPPSSPPTTAIPLGIAPDGKSLLPKLGPDGEPLKGPPLDKDGKPLAPPPIIGLDGKELARPTDSSGKPLPIYVSPDGKPILDVDGKPIPLRFNNEGKPIPLEMEFAEESPPEMGPPPPQHNSRGWGGGDEKNVGKNGGESIPNCVFYAGIVDTVASLILTATLIYFLTEEYKHFANEIVWKLLSNPIGSTVDSALGAFCGALPVIATRKNKFGFLWIWFGTGAFFLVLELVFTFAPGISPPKLCSIIPAAFCGVRLVYILCTNCFFASTASSSQQPTGDQQQYHNNAYQYAPAPKDAYPRGEMVYYSQHQLPQVKQQAAPTIVVQQPQYIQQPVMVHQPVMSYGFGYGYPTNYGGGWGMGYAGGGWGGWGGLGYGFGGYGCHGYCPYYDYWGW